MNQDVPTSLFKQKWIYDCIRNGDYSNEISKKFEVFEKKGLQNKILELLETFSEIPNLDQNQKFFYFLKNLTNNLIICFQQIKRVIFKTHLYFQIILLAYIKKAEIGMTLKSKINLDNKLIDVFEVVFIELFFKKRKKISKTFYLFKLLVKLIRKK